MYYKRVAVLRGGPSDEYTVSMMTGAAVLRALKELGYPVKDIVITKKGVWLENGIVRKPEQALEAVDVAFVALHGEYGEDGEIQKILQRLNIPFTGSNALTSKIALNKALTKDAIKHLNISRPKHKKVSRSDITRLDKVVDELNRTLGEELFVKPNTGGSSLGAQYTPNSESLRSALETLLKEYEELIVEEFIRGKEASVGVLEDFRDQKLYALPVVEIVPPAGEPLFSYENKYNGATEEICPGRFSYAEKVKLEDAARDIHAVLQCDHYSRCDFIVRNGDIYFLEVNTLPGLTDESIFPKAALAVGMSYKELIDHLVKTAKA